MSNETNHYYVLDNGNMKWIIKAANVSAAMLNYYNSHNDTWFDTVKRIDPTTGMLIRMPVNDTNYPKLYHYTVLNNLEHEFEHDNEGMATVVVVDMTVEQLFDSRTTQFVETTVVGYTGVLRL